jgi:hypothetical protein
MLLFSGKVVVEARNLGKRDVEEPGESRVPLRGRGIELGR